jgi:dihydroorotate dehydrogenase
MMERENHKSVQEDSEEVAKLLAKDVLQGFSLPVLPKLAPDLDHAMVQPAGVVKQF